MAISEIENIRESSICIICNYAANCDSTLEKHIDIIHWNIFRKKSANISNHKIFLAQPINMPTDYHQAKTELDGKLFFYVLF